VAFAVYPVVAVLPGTATIQNATPMPFFGTAAFAAPARPAQDTAFMM